MTEFPLRKITHTWWPLAASWLLMGSELPIVSAVLARLAQPKIHLAAYGGVVFPIALIIEAPIIMLLAASTALSKDWDSYCKIRKFMMWAGFLLTVAHFAFASTPVYYLVVEGLLGAPEEIIEPARLGMMIMIPWSWSIAYRRFHQGVLIRFDHSQTVGSGTVVRLLANASAMVIAVSIGGLPGIAVGTIGIATGVITEAVFIGWRVRPIIRDELQPARKVDPPLTRKAFIDFYVPLAMTSTLLLIVQPMGSAALSRMPLPLESLAAWPVLGGFIFMFRSMGFAYNEVVVALLDEQGSLASLRKFTRILFWGATVAMFFIAATPLSRFWFVIVSGLEPDLANLAQFGLWLAILWPGLAVIQNWFQGAIVNGKVTRGVTEAVVVFMLVSGGILLLGILIHTTTGLYVGIAAFVIGQAAQDVWLWIRSKPVLAAIRARDVFVEIPGELGASAD